MYFAPSPPDRDNVFCAIQLFAAQGGSTLNGRLPLKHGSDRPQTLPKRVSDDSQHFIVRRQTKKNVFLFKRFAVKSRNTDFGGAT